MIGSEALWLAQIIKTSMDVMNPPNNLDRYLKAIGADLPLPEGADGWWALRPGVYVAKRPVLAWDGMSPPFWFIGKKNVYRWRPFSSY